MLHILIHCKVPSGSTCRTFANQSTRSETWLSCWKVALRGSFANSRPRWSSDHVLLRYDLVRPLTVSGFKCDRSVREHSVRSDQWIQWVPSSEIRPVASPKASCRQIADDFVRWPFSSLPSERSRCELQQQQFGVSLIIFIKTFFNIRMAIRWHPLPFSPQHRNNGRMPFEAERVQRMMKGLKEG